MRSNRIEIEEGKKKNSIERQIGMQIEFEKFSNEDRVIQTCFSRRINIQQDRSSFYCRQTHSSDILLFFFIFLVRVRCFHNFFIWSFNTISFELFLKYLHINFF